MPFRINFGTVSIYNYLPDYNGIRPSIINVQLFIILLFSGTFPAFNLSFSTCFFCFGLFQIIIIIINNCNIKWNYLRKVFISLFVRRIFINYNATITTETWWIIALRLRLITLTQEMSETKRETVSVSPCWCSLAFLK